MKRRKRGYDYGVSKIARATGLTGVQSKNIAKALQKQNIGYDLIDWHTLGGDARDYGDPYNAVWDKLNTMYGVSKPTTQTDVTYGNAMADEHYDEGPPIEDIHYDMQLGILQQHHAKRPPRSRQMDERIQAQRVCKITDTKCIQRWMEHPEELDVEGVDFFEGISKKRKRR